MRRRVVPAFIVAFCARSWKNETSPGYRGAEKQTEHDDHSSEPSEQHGGHETYASYPAHLRDDLIHNLTRPSPVERPAVVRRIGLDHVKIRSRL